jgi:hypothetical protein
MAGFADIGALAGMPANNELSYQKGLALGANTQNAMQQARERVRQNQAFEQLNGLADELGIPPAMVTAMQAGINPQQISGAAKDIQESGFRTHVVDPTTGANQTQRYLAALAPGSFAQPFDKVGGGYASKLDPETGIVPLPPGAHESGGGISAQIQLLTALGLIDDTGRITDPKLAMANLREMNHFGDAGGVPIVTNTNPYGSPDAAVAPAAAPGLGNELAPPPPVAGPAPAPVVPASTKAPVAPAAASQVVPTSQAAQNVAALAAAKEVGQAQGTKAAALPSTINTLGNFSTAIDDLTKQKGFDSIYGHIQGTAIGQKVTKLLDQDAANASAARDTLKSDAFTVAIQKMRGLGQLSNMEGQKVETALTRMFDPQISPAEARKAAQELKLSLANLERVARQEAGDGKVDALLNGGAVAPSAAPAATGVAPYADAAKEARYQAWKAAQGR